MRNFERDSKGNITLMAVGAIALIVFMGGSIIDYMSLSNQKQQLQGIADRAAIAAAQELVVFKGTDSRVNSVANAFVNATYTEQPHITDAVVIDDGKAVEVTISAEPKTYFPGPIAEGVSAIKVKAIAEISGGGYVCMVGLSPTKTPRSTCTTRRGSPQRTAPSIRTRRTRTRSVLPTRRA